MWISLWGNCIEHYWFVSKTQGRYLETLPAFLLVGMLIWKANLLCFCSFSFLSPFFFFVFLWCLCENHITLFVFIVLCYWEPWKFLLGYYLLCQSELKCFQFYTGQHDIEYISKFAVNVYMEHKTGLPIDKFLCFYLFMLLILFPILNIRIFPGCFK